MKWIHFLKSMVLPIIKLHHYGPKQMGKLSDRVIKKAIECDVNEGCNWKLELDT